MFSIINYFKKRPAILVFFITFYVYSPILFNQYVGDDHHIIERNTFYRSWQNIPLVFEKGGITNTRERVFNSESQTDFGTARASYRPISSLTYFLDYYLFQAKPNGSHLIDILIHCVNSVLVYCIVYQIFSSSVLGVFAGLLFSLHPIQSEAVAVMSYRADIFTGLLVLFSFYFWIKFKQGGYAGKKYYYGSLIMCFLALFSKESAFMLPFVIILFDQALGTQALDFKPKGMYYLGFILIFIFYLYVYFIVFPSDYHPFYWLGGSFIYHCLVMGEIWNNYLISIFFPWTVKVIPAQYSPPVPRLFSLVTAGIVISFIILIRSLFVLWYKHKKGAFFLLWYIIFYLPVSNLIPVVNPMAYRYMYLPSIGLLVVLAVILHDLFQKDFIREYSRYLSSMLYVAVILICVTRTLFLNSDWKSDFDVAWACVRDYPTDHQGYAVIGGEYFEKKDFEKAKGYFELSVQLGGRMPAELIKLTECYIYLGKIEAAELVLKNTISFYPDYDLPRLYLGEIYFNQKHFQQAQDMLEKALILNPKQSLGYMFLMKVYLHLHKFEAAKDLLKKAAFYLNAQNVSELRNVLERSN